VDADAYLDLQAYAAGRDALFARLAAELAGDERVAAAWLSGSFGRGEADEWADFDLHVAVYDAYYPGYLDERPQLYARVGRPILVQPEVPSNAVNGGRFQLVVYTGCYEIDWNIGPLSRATRNPASQVLFERVPVPVVTQPPLTDEERRAKADHWLTFFWAMAPIAVKYTARGETRRATSQIELLTTAYIALWRLATDPGGPDPWVPSTNRVLEPDLDALIPRLGTGIDPLSALEVVRAHCALVEQLHPILATFGTSIPARMPDEVRALGRLAETVIGQGDPPRRKYR
jgi:predicted nucleotidyltransferase